MKKIIFRMLCICFLIAQFCSKTSVWADTYNQLESKDLYAKAFCLMDGENGRVLLTDDGDVAMANASTTKILTCIIALENADLDEKVLITKNAQNQPKVRLNVKEGETYILKDLLYAMMMESYNDCAVAIAEHIAGDTDRFATIMNQKANSIGCNDTCFFTPNGLDFQNNQTFHHTTAIDLCQIMRYCCFESSQRDVFKSIAQTTEYAFSEITSGRKMNCYNRNELIRKDEDMVAGKTGYTAKAGYCYVAAYEEKDGQKFCISLLACGWPNHKTYKWQDTRRLITYAQTAYSLKKINIPQIDFQLQMHNGVSENQSLRDWGKVTYITPSIDTSVFEVSMNTEEKMSYTYSVLKQCNVPIADNEIIGYININIDEVCIKRIPIYIKKHIECFDKYSLYQCVIRYYLGEKI